MVQGCWGYVLPSWQPVRACSCPTVLKVMSSEDGTHSCAYTAVVLWCSSGQDSIRLWSWICRDPDTESDVTVSSLCETLSCIHWCARTKINHLHAGGQGGPQATGHKMAHGFGSNSTPGCQAACNNKVEVPLMIVRDTGLAGFRNNPFIMNQDHVGPCLAYHDTGTHGAML